MNCYMLVTPDSRNVLRQKAPGDRGFGWHLRWLREPPGLSEIYRRKLAEPETALSDPEIHSEAAGVLRGLIDGVVPYPGEQRGEVRAELRGEIAALMQLGEARKQKTRVGETRVSLVAGRGFAPLTFGLRA